MNSSGFIFDYSKCVGCHACVVACYNENKTNPPIAWRQVNTFNQEKIPIAGFLNLSIACNHCIDAPCIKACPAQAYSRDGQTWAVIHNSDKCIGCKYCTWACPFDAPKFNESKGIVEKCHLCNHLLIKGAIPACANQCPTGALSYGSIEESAKVFPFGTAEIKNQPRLKTLNSDIIKNVPLMDHCVSAYIGERNDSLLGNPTEKIDALKEWPLIVYTFIYALLTGWFISFKPDESLVHKVIFISLGILGIAISTFHLGKPFRAYRSIINIKTSWLSSEILFSGLFLALSMVYIFILQSVLLFVIISILGLFLLISIEMVYSLPKKKYSTPIHSSNSLLTALLFGFYFIGWSKLLVAIIVFKSLLYIFRKASTENLIQSGSLILTFVRVILGLIFPMAIILFTNPLNSLLVLVCLLIGELIDRFEFYNDIYIDYPSRVLNKIYQESISEEKI